MPSLQIFRQNVVCISSRGATCPATPSPHPICASYYYLVKEYKIWINATNSGHCLLSSFFFKQQTVDNAQKNIHCLAYMQNSGKVTTSFIMSCLPVHPSVHMEKHGFRWTDFHEIYFSIFQKSVKKIQVSLKLDKNNRYSTWRPTYSFDHTSLSSS